MKTFRLTYTTDRENIVTGVFTCYDGDDFAAVWEEAWHTLAAELLPSELLKVQAVNILILEESVVQ
jgi:hypothetical protein